ncbi:MAG: hypothetical protein R2744_08490 [Bacteroidales bacterium]
MVKKDVFTEEDFTLINREFGELINNLIRCNKPEDKELITRAFELANKAHLLNMRREGRGALYHTPDPGGKDRKSKLVWELSRLHVP